MGKNSAFKEPGPRPKLHVVKTPAVKEKEQKKKLARHFEDLKGVSPQSIKKIKSALKNEKNKAAMDYLLNRGLTAETINYFNIGLSSPYKNKKGVESKNALLFPVINKQGDMFSPYAYYNIPGFSVNPASDNGWCRSSPRLSFNTKLLESHQYMFVAEGFKDLWILHQHLKTTDLFDKVIIVTS